MVIRDMYTLNYAFLSESPRARWNVHGVSLILSVRRWELSQIGSQFPLTPISRLIWLFFVRVLEFATTQNCRVTTYYMAYYFGMLKCRKSACLSTDHEVGGSIPDTSTILNGD